MGMLNLLLLKIRTFVCTLRTSFRPDSGRGHSQWFADRVGQVVPEYFVALASNSSHSLVDTGSRASIKFTSLVILRSICLI